MYQTNEPIFSYIYMPSSFRDILIDRGRGSGWSTKHGSFNIFNRVIGIYLAKHQGLQTLKSGMINLYQNKMPIYEMISGASIALAAFLLIVPGFFTDFIGFLLLIPFTRKILFKFAIGKKLKKNDSSQNKTIDGEIIENKKDEL